MVKNKILLIEDDMDIILWIQSYLEEFGFEITPVDTVTDAISHINQKAYDIVLLDINLPDFSGYEVLKYIQDQNKELPVIVISGYTDQKTKLYTFILGSSYFIVKPFDLEELEARIRLHIKTKKLNIEEEKSSRFCIKNNQAFFNGEVLTLTKIEFEILQHLIKHKNSTIQRTVLCESLSSLSSERSLDYHIRNIRKKICKDASNPEYLITDYGVGYKLIF